MPKNQKNEDYEQRISELTQDLQRMRADFENYRKRVDVEKEMAKASGKVQAISSLLPVIDNIERAIGHMPEELKDNAWANGVVGLVKNLDKSLTTLNLSRIEASVGTPFNHELHEAVQFDEDANGEHEVIAEELQAGYKLGDDVLRPAMVKVTKR
jgi:molecular chaperone GrpE